MTDKEFAKKIRATIHELAGLMNDARDQNGLKVVFNIGDVEDMRTEPPTKVFMETVSITKEIV